VQVPITSVNPNNFTSKFEQIYAILDHVRVFQIEDTLFSEETVKIHGCDVSEECSV